MPIHAIGNPLVDFPWPLHVIVTLLHDKPFFPELAGGWYQLALLCNKSPRSQWLKISMTYYCSYLGSTGIWLMKAWLSWGPCFRYLGSCFPLQLWWLGGATLRHSGFILHWPVHWPGHVYHIIVMIEVPNNKQKHESRLRVVYCHFRPYIIIQNKSHGQAQIQEAWNSILPFCPWRYCESYGATRRGCIQDRVRS